MKKGRAGTMTHDYKAPPWHHHVSRCPECCSVVDLQTAISRFIAETNASPLAAVR
jgi:hypothetical protein